MNRRWTYIGVFVLVLCIIIAITVFFTINSFNDSTDTVKSKAVGPKLVIDHDGGADDVMGIFIAILSDKYLNGPELIALTTNFGNVDETQTFKNTLRVLNIVNQTDIAVYRGCSEPIIEGIEKDSFFGADGLGDIENAEIEYSEPQTEHAVLGLIKLSKMYEGNLTVIALGPLTNIALAMKIDDEFIDRIGHLYLGAGNLNNGQLTQEFNAAMDPEAYYIVMQHAKPEKVTVLPFSQVKPPHLDISKEWRKNVLGAIPTEIIEAQNRFERVSLANSTTWSFLDSAVVSVALNNSLIEKYKFSNSSIILCGNYRGVNINEITTPADIKLIYKVKQEEYKSYLLNVFSAELN